MQPIILTAAVLGALLWTGAAEAEDAPIQITLKDHRFTPSEIHVISGKPIWLEITNADTTADEFESGILAIEKLVPAGNHVRVRLRPLAPGRYPFMGEFHAETAQGVIIADPAP
jgi:heme/copper-type cytochrome/quinol oxidase subunit 2